VHLFYIISLLLFASNAFSGKIQITFIRHGEAEHNVLFAQNEGEKARQTHDPMLTELGITQAKTLALSLKGKKFDTILTSPLKRAVQTTLLVFEKRDTPIVVFEAVAEHKYSPCDQGSSPALLSTTFPRLNFSHLSATWNNIESKEAFSKRITDFPKLLRSFNFPQNSRIAIVAHGAFFRNLLNYEFKNCEFVEIEWDLENPPLKK